jgi:hypothetical protein
MLATQNQHTPLSSFVFVPQSSHTESPMMVRFSSAMSKFTVNMLENSDEPF